jgi:GT2 family glycosyltransferase
MSAGERRVTTRLSIISVNYHSEIDLRKCMESIQRYEPRLQYEWILVDNGSTEGKLDRSLQGLYLPIGRKVIRNDENAGFAKACNQGMAQSHGQYILLLNPDTLLVENSISQMIHFMDHHPEAGVVGCKQILPSGRHYVGDAGYYPSLGKAFNHSFFLSRFFPNLFKGIYLTHVTRERKPMEVDWVSGGCLLFRREVMERAGGMDEAFFLYSEDMEWCKRVKQRGWQIYYLLFTSIVHHRSNHANDGDRAPGLWLKSQIGLYRRDHREISTRIFTLTVLSGLVLRSAIYLLLSLFFRGPGDRSQAKSLLCSVSSYLQERGHGKG